MNTDHPQMGSLVIQAPKQPFLTIGEVATYLGKSESTLRTWIKKGFFPRPILVNGDRVWWNLTVASFISWSGVSSPTAPDE